MNTQKPTHNHPVNDLLDWFPQDDFDEDNWVTYRYTEGVRYLTDRYGGRELRIMERSSMFWKWWNMVWENVDKQFLGACHTGCFEWRSPFTLAHYKAIHERHGYFIPTNIEQFILKQPIKSLHEQTTSNNPVSTPIVGTTTDDPY